MEKLKPCFSCRCALPVYQAGNNDLRHTIKCPDCPLRMEFFSSNKEQAFERWNKRPKDILISKLVQVIKWLNKNTNKCYPIQQRIKVKLALHLAKIYKD